MSINETILAQTDPFEFIYECISFSHGQELYDYIIDMYNHVVIDYDYHPDDDFESIINVILDQIEEEER